MQIYNFKTGVDGRVNININMSLRGCGLRKVGMEHRKGSSGTERDPAFHKPSVGHGNNRAFTISPLGFTKPGAHGWDGSTADSMNTDAPFCFY